MDDTIPFTKGHGTGNDFVLIADPDARIAWDAATRAAITDRHFGVGGDGLIRAVRTQALPEAAGLHAEHPNAEWFMDYSNADGSAAEMCGNGIRVFVSFLLDRGLVSAADSEWLIGTRAGALTVRRTARGFAVNLGAFVVAEGLVLVHARGLDVARPGVAVGVGNPHVVVALATDEELDALDLSATPQLEPAPPAGANVEFVVPGDPMVDGGVGRIRMRVHERGVGETLSCGTGAAAAALASRHWAGDDAPLEWRVRVPGGELGVLIDPDSSTVTLDGGAELVYDGTLTL